MERFITPPYQGTRHKAQGQGTDRRKVNIRCAPLESSVAPCALRPRCYIPLNPGLDEQMDVVRHQPNQGWIEVIVGSMFSGKSEELIRRLRRAQIARQKVQIFKPAIDSRYADDHIVSHSEMRIASAAVTSSRRLLEEVDADTEVVGIDEGQFFDLELPTICNTLADRGKRVIVAGLDQDYLGKPFEPMPQLLAIAEYITKTLAICMVCGNPANHTQRLVASADRVLLGASGMYEARCRACFDPSLSLPSVAQETPNSQLPTSKVERTDPESPQTSRS
jgi:thymidine kinase